MFDQLDIVEERYEQLNELLSDPDVVNDSSKLRAYSKEQADLQKTVEVYTVSRVHSKQVTCENRSFIPTSSSSNF